MAAASVQIIHESETAHVLLQPVRIQILERLAAPASATSLASEIGLPRQQVNYHLRELERAGLVEFTEERRRGNCVERLYRSVADSFVIAPKAVGGLRPDARTMRDRGSSDYLVAIGARMIEDIDQLRSKPSARVATLAIESTIAFDSDSARADFAEDLARAVTALAAKYHTEGAAPYRLVCAVHPEAGRNQ